MAVLSDLILVSPELAHSLAVGGGGGALGQFQST